MRFSDGRGLTRTRWQNREQVTQYDIDWQARRVYMNIVNVLAMYAKGNQEQDPADTVIAGLQVSHDSGLTVGVKSGGAVSFTGSYMSLQQGGWGFNGTTGEPFAVISPEDETISVDSGDSSDRIDILQVRPTNTQVDNRSRLFLDPLTELPYSADIDTAVHYGVVLEIKKGTAGSGAAPDVDGGYIKLAEITVPAGAGSISANNIVDFRDPWSWTTEVGNTIQREEGRQEGGVAYLSNFATFQAAMDYISNSFGRGTLYVDEDRDVTQEITDAGQAIQLYKGINIIGTLGQRTKITSTNETYLHFQGTDADEFTMKNLHLVGPGINEPGGGGIFLTRSVQANLGHIIFEDMLIEDVVNDGIAVSVPILSGLRNVKVLKCAGHCFNVFGGTSTNFYECYGITSVKAGFRLETMTYCHLSGCAAEVNGVAYDLDQGRNITLSGCGCEGILNRSASFPGHAFRVTNGENNVFNTCYSRNVAGNGVHIEGGSTSRRNTFIGHRTLDTQGSYSFTNTNGGFTTLIECFFDSATDINTNNTVQIKEGGIPSLQVSASSEIYDTTADGIAGTTDGDYFWVPDADGDLELFKNNSGSAVSQLTIPSTGSLGTAATENDTRYAHRTNNLSDLQDAASARSNLDVDSSSEVSTKVSDHSNKSVGIHEVTSQIESVTGSKEKIEDAEHRSRLYTDAHEGKTTGVHGVLGGTVESTTGAQQKADAAEEASQLTSKAYTRFVEYSTVESWQTFYDRESPSMDLGSIVDGSTQFEDEEDYGSFISLARGSATIDLGGV